MQLPPHEVSLQAASESQAISELTFDEAERADNGNIDHQDEPEENSTSTLQNEESRNFGNEASTALTTLDQGSRNVGGRPKGTTNEALRDFKFKKKLALQNIWLLKKRFVQG